MLTIIDANMFSAYLGKSGKSLPSLLALQKRIRKEGILVYSLKDDQYAEEIRLHSEFHNLLRKMRRSPRVQQAKPDKLRKYTKELEQLKKNQTPSDDKKILSNDLHILALAKATDARVLCTEDAALAEDFKNIKLIPKVNGLSGKIFPHRGSRWKDFLNRHKCPSR